MLGIVERRVQIEDYLRDDSELLGHHVAELAAVCTDIVVQDAHDLFRLGRREYADIGLGDRQVGAYAHLADGHHGAAEGGHALAAQDLGHILLDLPRDLELSCTRCLLHAYFTFMM